MLTTAFQLIQPWIQNDHSCAHDEFRFGMRFWSRMAGARSYSAWADCRGKVDSGVHRLGWSENRDKPLDFYRKCESEKMYKIFRSHFFVMERSITLQLFFPGQDALGPQWCWAKWPHKEGLCPDLCLYSSRGWTFCLESRAKPFCQGTWRRRRTYCGWPWFPLSLEQMP